MCWLLPSEVRICVSECMVKAISGTALYKACGMVKKEVHYTNKY